MIVMKRPGEWQLTPTTPRSALSAAQRDAARGRLLLQQRGRTPVTDILETAARMHRGPQDSTGKSICAIYRGEFWGFGQPGVGTANAQMNNLLDNLNTDGLMNNNDGSAAPDGGAAAGAPHKLHWRGVELRNVAKTDF